jgi:hypothetical protein
MDDDSKTTELSNVIQIDDDRIQDHLGRVVRSTVEEKGACRSTISS